MTRREKNMQLQAAAIRLLVGELFGRLGGVKQTSREHSKRQAPQHRPEGPCYEADSCRPPPFQPS
jgi:hypothetical protein